MSIISDVEKFDFLRNVIQRIEQSQQALIATRVSLQDVAANWDGYASRETDQAKLAEAGADFASRVTTVWNDRKADLLTALGILAGGMGTTVAALLEELGE